MMVSVITVLPFFAIFGISLLPVGVYFLCSYQTNMIFVPGISSIKIIKSIVVDYTNCTNELGAVCMEWLNSGHKSCECENVDFTVDSPLNGDVIVYYQLDLFNETAVYKEGNFSESRDDLQLLGDLTKPPSNSCEPYAYADGKPIAPCGAVADSMFADEIDILDLNLESYPSVPQLDYGIVPESAKEKYQNPSEFNTTQDLRKAFENVSLPIHWSKDVWLFKNDNISNSGFQNERFIGWMSSTDEPNGPKPAWRVDRNTSRYRDGLPAGNYSLSVAYKLDYQNPNRYLGPRKVVIASTKIEYEPEKSISSLKIFSLGISALTIGVLFLLCTSGTVVYGMRTNWGKIA